MTRARVFYLSAWLCAAGAAIFAATSVASVPSSDADGCPNALAEDGLQAPSLQERLKAQPRLSFVSTDSAFTFQFDDSRRALKREVSLELARGLTAPVRGLNNQSEFNARVGGSNNELRGPSPHTIGATQVEKSLKRMSEHYLALCVRLDPAELAVVPGTYTGTVGVAYSDQMQFPVPITVTFRDSRTKAAIIALLGVALGLVVKMLSEAAAIARERKLTQKVALRSYVSELIFPANVILAVIGGVFAYEVLYAQNHEWGSTPNDALKLFAACFVLQLSTSEAIATVSRFAGGPLRLPGTGS